MISVAFVQFLRTRLIHIWRRTRVPSAINRLRAGWRPSSTLPPSTASLSSSCQRNFTWSTPSILASSDASGGGENRGYREPPPPGRHFHEEPDEEEDPRSQGDQGFFNFHVFTNPDERQGQRVDGRVRTPGQASALADNSPHVNHYFAFQSTRKLLMFSNLLNKEHQESQGYFKDKSIRFVFKIISNWH